MSLFILLHLDSVFFAFYKDIVVVELFFLVGVRVSVTLLIGSSLTCLFFCFARFTFSALLNLLENYLQLVYYPGVS